MQIKVIVESMPRCGTHYLIRNLMQSFDLGYSTIYPAELRKGQVIEKLASFDITYDAAATWYTDDGGQNIESAKANYVCKTHFTSPMTEIAPKIYLWGDVLDYVYLTSRLWSKQRSNPDFILTADNQHFEERVARHFDRLDNWLSRVVGLSNALRYEDLLFKPEIAVELVEKLFSAKVTADKWRAAEKKEHRIIFSGWEGKIESDLANYLIKRYSKYIWKGGN